MQFLFPVLAAGFLFVAVPPIVHLINMLRHRRQKWAAMDFLMASYRKQKKWIILRQLLLLLARIVAALLLIAMLAGWSGGSGWLDVLGGQTTHHIVVLDDSYSMSDTSGGSQAYDRALAALDGLSRRLAVAEGSHQLTVLRSSRAGLVIRGGSDAGDAAADMSAAELGADLRAVERIVATESSPLDDDCGAAIQLAVDLSKATDATRTVMYVMSDFRARDWENPERISESIGAMARQGTEIRMIDCASVPATNLAVTTLEPIPDVWVAGVPVVFRVTVKNYGSTPVRNINLASRVVRYGALARSADPNERFSGAVEALPALAFDRIDAGAEVTKQFQVFIAEAGTHAVEVELPDDTVLVDNRRTATLPLTDAARVLVIDGDAEGRGAYHVASVLDPGGQVRTGAMPDLKTPAFLRTARLDDLLAYRAIYLVDLPEVDSTAAGALQEYVENGGGLMWFLGSQTLLARYNEILNKPGNSLLPGRLLEPTELDRSGATSAPDLSLGQKHPLTEPIAVIGDAAMSLVRVGSTVGVEVPPDTASPVVRVLNRRDGGPFVMQHDVGAGRVVTVLSGLDGKWTNWTGDPTFVVFMLRANAYLWSSAAASTSKRVDDPVILKLSTDDYSRGLTYLSAVDSPPRLPVEEQAVPLEQSTGQMLVFEINPLLAAIDGKGNLEAMLKPGVSEFWLTRLDGSPEVKPVASVVAAQEGDLKQADRGEIRLALQPATVTFFEAEDVIASDETSSSGLMSLILLALLGLTLGGEQILAYFASYHPPVTASKNSSLPAGASAKGTKS
jgi:hypothetical protein